MSDESPITGFVMTGDVPNGRSGVKIEVTPSGLTAQTREHGRFVLRHADAKFERGGASGNMIFVRSTISDLIVGSEDPRFLALLRATADSATLSRIDDALAAESARRAASTRAGWKLFGVIVVLGVALYYAVIVAARASITALPRSVDVQLGDTAFESMRGSLAITSVPEVEAALATIVDRLTPHVDLDGFTIRPVYVDSDVVNAMALPGGRVFVYRGLIRILDGPDELAAVVAHEIAHVTERHGLERIAGKLGSFVLLRVWFGDAGAVLESLGGVAGELVELDWSREDEHEADRIAVETCAKAGIDPLALERAFEAMESAAKGQPEIPKWFGTHPPTAERRDAVRETAQDHPVVGATPIAVDWAKLREAIAN